MRFSPPPAPGTALFPLLFFFLLRLTFFLQKEQTGWGKGGEGDWCEWWDLFLVEVVLFLHNVQMETDFSFPYKPLGPSSPPGPGLPPSISLLWSLRLFQLGKQGAESSPFSSLPPHPFNYHHVSAGKMTRSHHLLYTCDQRALGSPRNGPGKVICLILWAKLLLLQSQNEEPHPRVSCQTHDGCHLTFLTAAYWFTHQSK